jgi:hypothetical protein
MKNLTRQLLALAAVASLFIVPGAVRAGEPKSLKGSLEVTHGDSYHDGHNHSHADGGDEALPMTEYWLDDGSKKIKLEFPGSAPKLLTGTKVSVTGEEKNGKFAVSSLREEAAPGGGKGGGGGSVTPVTGPRDLLVIMINFASDPTNRPMTVEAMRSSAFTGSNSMSNYYKESSFNSMWLKGKLDGDATDPDGAIGDVAGWFTINSNTSTCDSTGWANLSRQAATNAGWDLSGYEHVMHVWPFTPVCQWRGMGQLGGSTTWINGVEGITGWPDMHFEGLITHEIGHNLTLYHSRSLDCSSGGVRIAYANNCTYSEYGDVFDVMGRAYRHIGVRNKGHLGWVPSTKIANAVTGQTYTIQPIESGTTGLHSVRVARTNKDYLYIEARTPFGAFDTFLPSDDVVTGALLRTGADLRTNGNSYLIDTAPYTTSYYDAALQAGEAFVDTVKNIYVEVLSVNPDGSVTVLVRTGQANSAPTAAAGSAHGLTVGIEHQHDSATASDSTKNLGSYEWSLTACPATCPALSGATGQLSGGNAAVPGPTFTPAEAGTYRLSLTVWDTAGASATAVVDEVAL